MFKEETIKLVERAWSIEEIKKYMQDVNIDIEKLPFGKLSKDQILKAFIILKEIQRLLLSGQIKEQ